MLKLSILATVFFSFIVGHVHGQSTIGFNYDISGTPLIDFYDPLSYQPNLKISFTHNSNGFEKGYYFDKSLNKFDGFVKFDDDKIIFKDKDESNKIRLQPEDINSFVIGIDSFFVTSNFYYKDKLRTKPEFVQYITAFDGLIFARNYNFTSGVSQQWGGNPPVVETFIVKKEDAEMWDNFSDGNFRSTSDKYFGQIPIISEKLKEGDLNSDNPLSIIKMADYYFRYMNQLPVYFNKYWEELTDSRNSEYVSYIDQIEDTEWTISYYHNNIKLYQIDYSSFYPNIKNGNFISYFKNGTKRYQIQFEDNEQKELTNFYSDNSPKLHYYIEVDSSAKQPVNEYKYESFFNTDGKEQISSIGNNHVLEVDTIKSGYVYYTLINNKKVIKSYRMLDEDTVYLMTDPKFKFKINTLQDKFTKYISEMDIEAALGENAQGTILVSFVINPKGKVIDYKLLNTINPQFDRAIESFILYSIYKKDEGGHKFKPYKFYKKKQYCEVVIPFEFNIARYYRLPSYSNNYYYDPYLMNPWMYQNNLEHINPPSIPSHF